MKNKRSTKITAFMLVLCMMISMIPGNVIALTDDSAQSAETEQAVTPATEEKSLADEILEPIIVSEDITKRGENEKHFLCDDGSYIAVSYPQAVHEQVDGEWVDIEYDVTADGNGISPVDDTIKVRFANNTNSAKLVKLESGGYKISWTVEAENENGDITEKVKLSKESKATLKTTKEITQENKEKIKNEAKYTKEEVKSLKKQTKEKIKKLELAKTANIEQNEDVVSTNIIIEDHNREQIQSISFAQSNVEYIGAFGEGTTLRYVMSQGKINEEIVLESYNGFKSYSMVIDTDGLTPGKTENGRVNLTDENGETVVTIAAPYMYDSAEKHSYDVDVTVTQESKKEWRITYTPDFEWLIDKDRVYPVVIDPTVTTSNVTYTNIIDLYIMSTEQNSNHYSEPTLKVGYYNNTEYISYIQSTSLPTLPTGAKLTGAGLVMKFTEDTYFHQNIGLYSAVGSIYNGSLAVSNKPAVSDFLDNQASIPQNYWITFCSRSFGSRINNAYANGTNRLTYAIEFTGKVQGVTEFYSADATNVSDRPYFTFRYTTEFYNVPDGMYYIMNAKSGLYLDIKNNATTSGSKVTQIESSGQNRPIWEIKNIGEDRYNIIPHSATTLKLYAPDSGNVTVMQTTHQKTEWRFSRIEGAKYTISTVGQPWVVLDVGGQSMDEGAAIYPYAYHGYTNQQWILIRVNTIQKTKSMNIGDRYNLNSLSQSGAESCTFLEGAGNVIYDSSSKKIIAKNSGTTVIRVVANDTITYQLTVTILQSRPLADGIYYIRNEFSQKYMDIENPENGKSDIIANQCIVQQNTKDSTSKSQVWKITYDEVTGIYGLSPICNINTYLGKSSNKNNSYAQTSTGTFTRYNAKKWAIVPSDESNMYKLVSFESLDKVLSIYPNDFSNGTDIVLQERDDSSIAQNWIFEDATSGVKGVAQTLTIGETLTGTLNHYNDFEMYKVTLSGETKYSLTVNPPVKEKNKVDDKNLSDYANYTVVVYVNENQGFGSFEGLYMTNYQTQSFYLKCIGSGTKEYYIIIKADDSTNFAPGSFNIKIEDENVIPSSELDGWRYKGEKYYSGTSATLYYKMGEGMDEEQQYADGTFSYAELFEKAMEIWSKRLDDEGIPLSFKKRTWLNSNYFTVSTSNQIPDYIGGYNDEGNVVLNISVIDSSASSNRIVETFCHELGHSLGLADLYINSSYGYEYNGALVDNSDHLMYGTGGRNLGSNIIHNDEITGVNIIRAPGLNYSFKEYTEEDLYNESEYIVKGTVVDTEKYSDDYTRVYFAIDECLYANVNGVPNVISFLQYTPEGKYSDVDPLYKIGEKYLLYLSYGLFNELFVVGGPQGRFLVEDTDGEIEVTNQIDRVVEKEGKKQLGIEKKFSKKLKEFNKQAKEKIEKTKKNK